MAKCMVEMFGQGQIDPLRLMVGNHDQRLGGYIEFSLDVVMEHVGDRPLEENFHHQLHGGPGPNSQDSTRFIQHEQWICLSCFKLV